MTEPEIDLSTPTQPIKSSGSLFDKRFGLYNKINIKLKTMDMIIGGLAILLFVFFILGMYA
ncbi:MAG: hypothetical protein PHC86_06600 [Eubacteriales bacterium]|nr:hypothetical protein [Eubacteriales bacterium]